MPVNGFVGVAVGTKISPALETTVLELGAILRHAYRIT